jgi:integrase
VPRTYRGGSLETRTSRLKLPLRGKPYFAPSGRKGVHIGYRRTASGNGTWVLRRYLGEKAYELERVAEADDYAESDGGSVLTYFEAIQRLGTDQSVIQRKHRITVQAALDEYLGHYRVHARSATAIKQTQYKSSLIARGLGEERVVDLTAPQIRTWLTGLARTDSEDPDSRRQRKATANRLLTVLKAALNHAWRQGRVGSDEAWRRVARFRNVDAPSIRYLSAAECSRLLNVCNPDFRALVRAALETGCRYSELASLRVKDYNADVGGVSIPHAKSGTPRYIPLTDTGRAFFDSMTAGRDSEVLIFTHASGAPWSQSHQHRPMIAACKAAKIRPPIGFHHLRHTYGSLLSMKGTPMAVIAQALGHADHRMTVRHYAHLAPSYFEKTIRKNLPNFGAHGSNVRKLRP